MRNGDEMLQQIVEKSALDADFRQQLLADPKATIGAELGITMPESMTIKVHERRHADGASRAAAGSEHHRGATRSHLGRPLLLLVNATAGESPGAPWVPDSYKRRI